MDVVDELLQSYLEKHTGEEPQLLKTIARETHVKVPLPRMLSGHFQGRLLSMLSKLTRPSRILEIGTYTGYATLCLAEGLIPGGLIHTIEVNEELEERNAAFFTASAYAGQVIAHIGKAQEIIPTLTEVFDLVFIDADKKNNALYYDLVLEKMPSGGLIIVDNVLWSGKVVAGDTDKDTTAIRSFNEKIARDPRVEKLILPVRDGLFLARKI